MKAAVIRSFERAPHYEDREPPSPGEGEVRIAVRAAALTQLARGQASGKIYAAGVTFPFVPGADGVGRLDDGKRVYFLLPRAPHGAMAEVSVVDRRFCVDVPDGVDDVTAAAIANPGMSSWAGLERGGFERGQTVLVNGATGASGKLALQIAKHLGAGRVIATGRNAESVAPLSALGADTVIALDQAPATTTAAIRDAMSTDAVVILDYLGGAPAERVIDACVGRGPIRACFVQIGTVAGATFTVAAAALRTSGLEIVGSGLGSVPKERLVHAIDGVMKAIVAARFTVEAHAVPLADVEAAWQDEGSARIVFTT